MFAYRSLIKTAVPGYSRFSTGVILSPWATSTKQFQTRMATSKTGGSSQAAPGGDHVPFELEEDDIFAFALSTKRFCRVKVYRGNVYVDLREYFEDKDGVWSPSKKGLMMAKAEWENVKKHIPEIDQALDMAQKDV